MGKGLGLRGRRVAGFRVSEFRACSKTVLLGKSRTIVTFGPGPCLQVMLAMCRRRTGTIGPCSPGRRVVDLAKALSP